MKAEKYTLVSESVRGNTLARISEIPCDGKTTVSIGSSGSKSARQRGLQWRWYTDVAKAGIGGKHEDDKNGVHLVSKYRWALPILIRDDANFADLYNSWATKYKGDEFRMLWFIQTQVSTEDFNVSQMAEYLTNFQHHYLSHGVNLTNPDEQGLLQ